MNSSITVPTPLCTLCLQGAPMTLPDKTIAIEGFDFIDNCQSLHDVAKLLPIDSEQCLLIQSISTICGCPSREDSCHLCPSNVKISFPYRKLDFLADTFGGISPTCELVEAGLQTYSHHDVVCSTSQALFGRYCGCGVDPSSEPYVPAEGCPLCPLGDSAIANKSLDFPGLPVSTCGQLEDMAFHLLEKFVYEKVDDVFTDPCWSIQLLNQRCGCQPVFQEKCPICGTTGEVDPPLPDNLIRDGNILAIISGGLDISGGLSCQLLADVAQTFSSTLYLQETACKFIQGLGVSHCGCPKPQSNACSFCVEDNSDPDLYDKVIMQKAPFDGMTCRQFETAVMFFEDGDELPLGKDFQTVPVDCDIVPSAGLLCGCNNSVMIYAGADTRAKQIAAIWIQRISAFISICGSISILIDIWRGTRNRAGVYYAIVVGLCASDLMSSVAWGLGPLPTTELLTINGFDMEIFVDEMKRLTSFYGAHGNKATCKVQGFVLHLGFSSMLYNLALAYFFKLSVVQGWRDRNFTMQTKVILCVCPGLVGLIIACVSIPYITPGPLGCTIGTPSEPWGRWWKVLFMFYLPYGPTFLLMPVILWSIYRKVKVQYNDGVTDVPTTRSSTAEMVDSGHGDKGRVTRHANTREINLREGNLQTARVAQPSAWVSAQTLSPSPSSALRRLEHEVFRQSLWYGIGFYASYTIFLPIFASNAYGSLRRTHYWIHILSSLLTPLQGFFNAMIYFRRRFEIRRILQLCVIAFPQKIFGFFVSIFKRATRSSVSREPPQGRSESIGTNWDNILRSSYFLSDMLPSSAQPLSSAQPIQLLYEARSASRSHLHDEEEKREEEPWCLSMGPDDSENFPDHTSETMMASEKPISDSSNINDVESSMAISSSSSSSSRSDHEQSEVRDEER